VSDPNSRGEWEAYCAELAETVAQLVRDPATTPVEVWDVQDRIARLVMAYLALPPHGSCERVLATLEPLLEMWRVTRTWQWDRIPSVS